MLFNAFICFLLILTVILFLIQTIFPYYYIKKLTQFFTGVCLVYVLSLPFSLSKMYVDYYIFSIKKAKQCKNTSEQTADTSKSQPPSGWLWLGPVSSQRISWKIINAILALAAAIFAGISVYITRKYHKISLLQAKSENIQKFINNARILFSKFETIKNVLI